MQESIDDIIKIEQRIIKNRLQKRIRERQPTLLALNFDCFYIAGSSLLEAEPNDYDLFPTILRYEEFNKYFSYPKSTPFYKWNTINSISLENDGKKIQLCKFKSRSLEDLVERFDFTHVKLGAKVDRKPIGGGYIYVVNKVYLSPDYIKSRILNRSHYTGVQKDDYPLSSLIRTYKYYQRGAIKNIYDVLFHILESFLERGFKSEEDFYNQLSAIDLGIDEAIGLDENRKRLTHIYYLLTGEVLQDFDINRLRIEEMK